MFYLLRDAVSRSLPLPNRACAADSCAITMGAVTIACLISSGLLTDPHPLTHPLPNSSYDGSVALSRVGAEPTWSTIVAEHYDKVIQSRWHPTAACFASSSADHTVRLWSLEC
eukprot:m.35156 g.35156  ORF g.35156 m.35156 type:complete len:113 (-) comp10894_c0_seq3:170-508(-)